MPAMPTIRVNGEKREVPEGITVDRLVATLESEGLALDRRAIAVEVNRDIVPRSTYAVQRLEDEDQVEIVTIVGGG